LLFATKHAISVTSRYVYIRRLWSICRSCVVAD